MYCTQQMIQGENFHDWLKNRENCESFPPRKFCRIRYSESEGGYSDLYDALLMTLMVTGVDDESPTDPLQSRILVSVGVSIQYV